MFFSISKSPDRRFPHADPIGQWIFNHDDGWDRTADGWKKGYRYDDINHGNFCAVKLQDDVISLCHDQERSFPLWWDSASKILTNCVGTGNRIWADGRVELTSSDILTDCIDLVSPIDLSPLSFTETVEQIKNNLSAKISRLSAHPITKKIFVSGGVDTLILYSMIRQQSLLVEHLDYEHFEYDHFCDNFLPEIKKNHWAFNQMHHWRNPCMLLTGSCGDEFLFRGPSNIAIWTAWHDIDFLSVLEKQQGYHVRYFLLDKNKKIFQSCYAKRKDLQERFKTKKDLAGHLIDRNLNDHQHWHLGYTMTWTPFKDIELFKIMLRLDPQSLLTHFVDATVCQALILPEYLHMLSRHKNHQSRANLGQH
jgi:hypothetical protein